MRAIRGAGRSLVVAISLGLGLGLPGCREEAPPPPAPPPPRIVIDGSSTVYPMAREVARRYAKVSSTSIDLQVSGTGGGFEKFCAGVTAMNNASRPIKASESQACAAAGVEFIELPIAFDGIAVVVHPDNDWVDSLTVAELRRLWAPDAQGNVQRWSDIRPEWPNVPIHLFGPGGESGTFDYFTLATVGKEQSSRTDYVASEDDDELVTRVANDGLALGYFGFAYYRNNQFRLRAVPVDDSDDRNGSGAVLPTPETIRSAQYQPLSRPLFLYVNRAALERPEVADFVDFFLAVANLAADEVGSIRLPKRAYDLAAARLAHRQVGSTFEDGGSELGITVEALMEAETAAVWANAEPAEIPAAATSPKETVRLD